MSEVTDENAADCSAAEPNENQRFDTKELETYNILPRTINKGVDYEISLLVYYSIKLALQKDIQNFKISTNNAAYGKFDDVVAEILRNGIWNTFAMQLEHKKKTITEEQIEIYFKPNNLPKNCTCILFTNSSLDERSMANLNISDCDLSNSELLHYFDTNQQLEQEKTNILKKIKHREKEREIYYFTKQQNRSKIKMSIAKLFEQHFHLDSLASRKIAESFLKFFFKWNEEVFGNCKLDKEDIKAKVFELVFWDHIYNFNFEPQPNLEVQNFQLLKGVCNLSDIIIIKTVKDESLLSNLINPDFKSYQEDQDIRKKRKSCLLIPENCPTISERQLYYIMWKAGQIPLILNTTEMKKQTLYATLKFASIHRVILFGSNVDLADLQGFKIFQNLSDLKSIDSKTYYKLAKQFKLSLQGREPITLEQFLTYLGGQETGASIAVEQLLLMATGCILVGSKDNFDNLPQHYVPRHISRNVVHAKEVSRIKNCAVLIDCKGNKIDEIQKQIGGITTDNYVSVDDYLQGKGKKLAIILADQSSTPEQWDKLIQREKDAIHLKAIDHTKFEIIVHDSNSINKLKKYTTVDLVREDKIFDEFKNKLNVVCAEPGMGKSTFTAHLARTCPSHIWVKRIECKEYNKFFGNECNLEEALEHFSQDNQDALENLCVNRMKLLYIFDGLDEIDFEKVDNPIKSLKIMSDAGIKIWVSARHKLQERLEKGLRLLSMDIQEFSEEIQKTYIRDRLSDTYSNDEIDVVLKQVFENTCVIQNKEILGVPLQLYTLTQMLIDDKQLFRDMSEKTFVLTRMYYSFFEGKFKHYCQKMKITEESLMFDKEALHEDYEQQAIISTLSSHIVEFLPINLKKISQKYQRDKHYQSLGIIVNVQNSIPIFAHHTYAEYFTACWLVDNFKYIAEENRRFLFEEKYRNLRILLDMKLSEELPLHLAVLYKDIDGVKKNIDQINQRDSFGRTALHITRCSGIKLMNVLSPSDVNVNTFEKILEDYETRNINSSVKEIMKCLVQASNESTLEEDKLFRFTSMQYADVNLSLCLLEEISEKYPSKIDFSQLHSFSDLSTVLCYTVCLDYASLMKIAVHSVDNSSLKAILRKTFLSRDETLLSVAAAGGNIDSVELLIDKRANINSVNKYGWTPLIEATQSAYPQICKMLIDGGADVNQVDNDGRSPLMYASRNGSSEICKLLIEGGADINQVDKYGPSPGYFEIYKMLNGGGADINHLDKVGKSPLMFASINGNSEICKMLIDGGADINQVDQHGTSPLMYASEKGNSEICKLLIEGGADVNQVDKDGRSPLMYAIRNRNSEIYKLLIEGGADINQVDKYGTSSRYIEICKLLIDGGADINQVDKVGKSPLMYASRNGSSEICKLLIEGGADNNQVVKYGASPLMHASEKGNSEIYNMLIDGGADINQVDEDGKSPLMYASEK